MHDARPLERLRAIAAFSSSIAGHMAVQVLLKRWRLVTTRLDPHTIDESWCDNYMSLWRELATHTLGLAPPYMEATREQLWRMARSLVAGIDKHTPRQDHYPDGWAAMAAIVRTGKPEPQQQAAATAVSIPAPNPRLRILDTVDYVAAELGVDDDEVYRRVHRTRRTIKPDDARAVLALLNTAARAAGRET